MRLKPIEKPKNLLVKLAYWFTKREQSEVARCLIQMQKKPIGFFGII